MDGGRALFAFWAGADEPQTREGRVGGVFGGGPSIFSEAAGTNERIWAEEVTATRVIFLFLERRFEPPARLWVDACCSTASAVGDYGGVDLAREDEKRDL